MRHRRIGRVTGHAGRGDRLVGGRGALPKDPGDVQAEDPARRLKARNAPIHRLRCRIGEIFGTWKRGSGLRRMRWRGLAKAA